MIIKEPPNQNQNHHHHHHHHLLRHRPPALHLSESGTTTYYSFLAALCGHLPSSNDVVSSSDDEPDLPLDVFSDEFRMYEFKVRRCTRGGSHDWTECPYAHPGEKARRRDPLRYNYCGTSCTDFRKGSCKKGDSCEFAHGVFECWLHPSRYRTQLCKDGPHCQRRVCFFAHSPDQLRVGSKLAYPDSPRSNPVNDLIDSLTELQLNKVKSIPSSWKLQIGSPVFGSPRGPVTRPGFFSLPTTPTQSVNPARVRYLDRWETGLDEGVIQRVESGKELRARMFEKLSKENPLNGSDPVQSSGSGPDVGWVSDLIN